MKQAGLELEQLFSAEQLAQRYKTRSPQLIEEEILCGIPHENDGDGSGKVGLADERL